MYYSKPLLEGSITQEFIKRDITVDVFIKKMELITCVFSSKDNYTGLSQAKNN